MNVETKQVKLSALKLNPDNPRRIGNKEMERLVKSLQEFPDMLSIREIVVDETMTVLGGNMRLLALKKSGVKECTAKIVSGLSPAQKREFIIKDNSAFGEWDMDLLSSSWGDLPLVEWGVDLPDDWLVEEKADPADAEPQIDRAEELNKIWQVKAGDLWKIGDHVLLCGDSTKAEDVARVMGGEKADICFTSPPYNLGGNIAISNRSKKLKASGSAYSGGEDDLDHDSYLAMLCDITDIALSHTEYLLLNVQSLSGNKTALIEYLYKYVDRFADVAVWHKTNQQPAMAERVMNSSFEYVFFISGAGKPTRAIKTADFRGTFSNVYTSTINVNEFAAVHGAAFPTDFAAHFIGAFSRKSCLDLFLGTGTTMVACQNLNRKCRGIEISEAYCSVVLQRMHDAFPNIEIKRLS
jgi:hypothetical protein